MHPLKTFLVGTMFLTHALPGYAQSTFGIPVSTESGKCFNKGEQWELQRYDNDWYASSGPKGYFIGLSKPLLIALACGDPQTATPETRPASTTKIPTSGRSSSN